MALGSQGQVQSSQGASQARLNGPTPETGGTQGTSKYNQWHAEGQDPEDGPWNPGATSWSAEAPSLKEPFHFGALIVGVGPSPVVPAD